MLADPLQNLTPSWANSSDLRIDLPDQWDLLFERYNWAWDSQPVKWLADHLRKIGATRVQVEPYIDADYRDEFAHFYADTFTPPSVWCERLHLYRQNEYLGYCTLRPIPLRPVGRTALEPGRRLAEHISCLVEASPRPYGQPLPVKAFPFISQDSQFGRCAHAVIWMIAYYHHLQNRCPRAYMSDIVAAATPHESGRLFPSGGLTIHQVGIVFRELGLPMHKHNLHGTSHKKVEELISRYLNSRMPVALGSGRHMTALIGCGRDTETGEFFVVQADDAQGAYIETPVPPGEDSSWHTLMVPLPARIYLSGEDAQRFATMAFARLLRRPGFRHIATQHKLRIRNYVVHSRAYRRDLQPREVPIDVAADRMHARMPRWVWITELQDADVAATDRNCVIGEIGIDTTSDAASPGLLFGNLGHALIKYMDRDIPSGQAGAIELYETGTALNV